MNSFNTFWILFATTWRTVLAQKVLASISLIIVMLNLSFLAYICNNENTVVLHPDFGFWIIGGIFCAAGLGAGIISKERQQGILMTLFARPMRRATYILAKWLALVSATLLVLIIGATVQWLLFVSGMGLMIDVTATLDQAFAAIINVLATSALIVAISVFSPVFAEFALYAGAVGSMWIFGAIGQGNPIDVAGKVGWDLWQAEFWNGAKSLCYFTYDQLWPILVPSIDFGGAPMNVALDVVRFLAVMFTAFVVAVWALNRKELTYGAQ